MIDFMDVEYRRWVKHFLSTKLNERFESNQEYCTNSYIDQICKVHISGQIAYHNAPGKGLCVTLKSNQSFQVNFHDDTSTYTIVVC